MSCSIFLLFSGAGAILTPTEFAFGLVLQGLSGGLIAAVAMSAPVFLVQRQVPPLIVFWAARFGDHQSDPVLAGVIMHMIYGGFAGALFALGLGLVATTHMTTILSLSLGWSLFLAGFAMFVWRRIRVGVGFDINRLLPFLILHLVYGLVLGSWLSVIH